jgi:hypothetical protein
VANRISDIDDDGIEDWPELEEELVPDDTLVPDAGPFERPFQYLHGARVTLDSDLMLPTKMLAATSAKSVLRVAEQTGTEIPDKDREIFERVARGDIAAEEGALVEALGQLTSFVERNITLGDETS